MLGVGVSVRPLEFWKGIAWNVWAGSFKEERSA